MPLSTAAGRRRNRATRVRAFWATLASLGGLAWPSASAQAAKPLMEQASQAAAAGRNVDALALYAEAIEAAPKTPDAYRARALLFEELGHPELAARDLAQVAKLGPADAGLLTCLCRDLALANHDLDGAMAACNAAIKLAPEDPSAISARGYLNLRRGAYANAEKDFAAALNLSAADADFTFGRGLALIHLGQVKEGRGEISIATLDRASLVSDWEIRGFGMQGEVIAGRPMTTASQPSVSVSDSIVFLNKDEALVNLAGGCTRVVKIAGADQRDAILRSSAAYTWSGQCRFGVIHGAGKLAPSSGADAAATSFAYGRDGSEGGGGDASFSRKLMLAYSPVEAALVP